MRTRASIRRGALAMTAAMLSWVFLASGLSATAAVAPDPTGDGPFDVTSAEYKFPAGMDPEVVPDLPVELWARVYRPTDLSGGPFPLLVFLHGNHATCGFGSDPRVDDRVDYTFTGTCPSGYVVSPSHAGYGYLAERLASWGYIVVSINANRGINAAPATIPDDRGRNKARGRLILRHLQRLSEWNLMGGTPPSLGVDLKGKLDFNHVGLMGHSRGGEGVRAAYNFYRDPDRRWRDRIGPMTIEAVFEIGPVDGQTDRQFIADGVIWNVLLPMCDGDVSNLQGVRPFDRMLRMADNPATQKSTYTVWGANHNFFNTEWQISDSPGCFRHQPLWTLDQIGSLDQQTTGVASMMALFRGNVGAGADKSFNQNFNPEFDLPKVITRITRVDQGYTDSPNPAVTMVFEDFDKPTGTSSYGFPNDASKIAIAHTSVPEHSGLDAYGRSNVQRAGNISWEAPGDDVFFQTNWQAAAAGRDISGFKTLDLRISRQPSGLNPDASTNFAIQLVAADGTMSQAAQLANYTDVTGPVGGPYNVHSILQGARIPLADFGMADLTKVRGARFTFNDTPSDAIFLGNVRLSRLTGSPPDPLASREASGQRSATATASVLSGQTIVGGNAVTGLRSTASGVEIQLSSNTAFPVRDELVVLRVGARQFVTARYPDSGDTNTLIFSLTANEFAQLSSGDPLVVQYGFEGAGNQWVFGPLNKNQANQ